MSFFSFYMGIRQADYFVEVFSHSEILVEEIGRTKHHMSTLDFTLKPMVDLTQHALPQFCEVFLCLDVILWYRCSS